LYHLQPTNAFFWNILHGILKEKGLIIFGQNLEILVIVIAWAYYFAMPNIKACFTARVWCARAGHA
jgi:hypothetical protein